MYDEVLKVPSPIGDWPDSIRPTFTTWKTGSDVSSESELWADLLSYLEVRSYPDEGNELLVGVFVSPGMNREG